MGRRGDYYKNPKFEAGAAPEGIEHQLNLERRYLADKQRRVKWLEELLERRTAEREAGIWPGPPAVFPPVPDTDTAPEA